jgi:pyruvate/2-oxoacid:ferredoxin oxidoreductase beta subunit
VEILQSCPTYNKATPHEWYQSRVKDVSTFPNYKVDDIVAAREIAEDIENKIAIGVIYQNQTSLPFMARQANRQHVSSELVDEVKSFNPRKLFDAYR